MPQAELGALLAAVVQRTAFERDGPHPAAGSGVVLAPMPWGEGGCLTLTHSDRPALMPPALWTHSFGIWKGKRRLPTPPFCVHAAASSRLGTANGIYTWQVAGAEDVP